MAKRSGIMLCYPFEEKRLAKWGFPVIIQPKLDGVRCRYVAKDHVLLSSSEREITGVPHILKALTSFKGSSWEFDGELYNHHLTFEQINSIVSRTAELSPLHRDAQFHIFDEVDPTEPQHRRLTALRGVPSNTYIRIVENQVAFSIEEIMALLENYCCKGYEGIVVRHPLGLYERKRSTMVMKFKPRKSDSYRITGYKAEKDDSGVIKEPQRLGALVCEGDDGTEFSVGSGFTDAQRHSYWAIRDSLFGQYCHVLYQHTTPGKGVPRFPVFHSIVKPLG